MNFQSTRAAGLDRLSAFLPHAGRDYANTRNFDDGAPTSGARSNVSQLSPWLHSGLITETEVVETVLGSHSPDAAEKYIAEVFWRVYFKGYLEQRPTIWTAYKEGRDAALLAKGDNAGFAKAYNEATEGRTGIAAFDHWARELVETGYLHNHARMWFASIWIFTLRLDWQLGADFFLRHLIDGDAASNTLSWRWIGGLHTKGKTYLARADNIARYTANQPGGALDAQGLAQVAVPLEEAQEHQRRPLGLTSQPASAEFDEPYALMLHDEAASHVSLTLARPPALVIAAARPDARSSGSTGELARGFAAGAVSGSAAEAAKAYGCGPVHWTEGTALSNIMNEAGLTRIAVPYLPVGWTRDALMPELAPLMDAGQVTTMLGDLDRATWPLAKAGFFGVKKKIEAVLGEIRVAVG